MPLTTDFRQYIQTRLTAEPELAAALLREAVQCMLDGDLDTGRAVMKNYINATIGFERLAVETGTPSKSLLRMFGPKGNPQARNLFGVIGKLQELSGTHVSVSLPGV